jgi:protein SCO1/2
MANRELKHLSLLPKAVLALIVCAVFWLPKPLCAAGGISDSSPSNNSAAKQYVASKAGYDVPAITLLNTAGDAVPLRDLLAQPRPVLLQFIFTSCSTICPLLSATFMQVQSELERMKLDYQMISISIDPEYDTAQRLTAYAKRYRAGSHWMFLTGNKQDIHRVLAAFDALYQSDNKMSHRSLFYLRAAPNTSWLRIEGFISVEDMMDQFRSISGLAKNTVR